MSVFLWEMKKIWTARSLLLVALLCFLYYNISSMEFCVRTYPNGHPGTEELEFMEYMAQEYGMTLDDNEFQDFLGKREGLVFQADAFIAENPIFAAVSIYSYADFEKLDETGVGEMTADQLAAYDALAKGVDSGWILYKLQTIDSMKAVWENAGRNMENIIRFALDQARDGHMADRLEQIRDAGEWRNTTYAGAFDNVSRYISNFAVLALLATLVFVSPVIATDRERKISPLQYASRQGRRILAKQCFAAMVSAFLLVALLALAFGGVYAFLGPGARIARYFWGSGLDTIFGVIGFRVPMALAQYVAWSVAVIILLAMGVSAFAVVLSRFSGNTVALVLKVLPAFIAMAYVCGYLLGHLLMFDFTYPVTVLSAVRNFAWWSEMGFSVLFFIVGVMAAVGVIWRERWVDVV